MEILHFDCGIISQNEIMCEDKQSLGYVLVVELKGKSVHFIHENVYYTPKYHLVNIVQLFHKLISNVSEVVENICFQEGRSSVGNQLLIF